MFGNLPFTFESSVVVKDITDEENKKYVTGDINFYNCKLNKEMIRIFNGITDAHTYVDVRIPFGLQPNPNFSEDEVLEFMATAHNLIQWSDSEHKFIFEYKHSDKHCVWIIPYCTITDDRQFKVEYVIKGVHVKRSN